ncbi:hypothetical protein CSW08_15290 [Confluentibacter flavum]|uniref:Uncharacterized protein n=1 Tax=Confluentibacter flavum TaxID=1909700 RepID=A0A2N3HG88_9FLAO|nr:hypothetical protein CSW08_15290 [Confluentibacter flavum]
MFGSTRTKGLKATAWQYFNRRQPEPGNILIEWLRHKRKTFSSTRTKGLKATGKLYFNRQQPDHGNNILIECYVMNKKLLS